MRASIVATSFASLWLLAGGCGSDASNPAQDATPAGTADAPIVNRDVPAADTRDAAGPTDRTADLAQGGPETSAQDATADVPAIDGPKQDANATDLDRLDLSLPGETGPADAGTVEVGSGEAGSAAGVLAQSALPREQAVLSASEQNVLATTLSGFAFALWQELRKDAAANGNFACSPTSISLALGMAYAGAKGSTASQMKSALHITTASDAYFRSLNWLDQQLEARADAALKQAQAMSSAAGRDAGAPDPANYRLHVVNGCWGERSATFEQPYLDTLATAFGSGIHLADFKTQPDVERVGINTWVSQETLNRINDLIPSGAIDTATRMVLVNAIHLKLPWYQPFSPALTTPGTFTKANGAKVNASFMNKTATRLYAEDDTTQAVAIPLSGNAVELVVFLPKATSSLAQFESSLPDGHAQTLLASLSAKEVVLALPKFVFTTASVKLRTALVALGMTDAFSDVAADFTGITKAKPLFISDVVHKAMVGVDEQGVEAAAATAVLLAGSGLPPESKEVKVDRPFFFGIYDQPTSTWLFLGHVTDPSS